ncbi:MAG: recombinase family protein [Fusobacteriaceae bacterium]
MIYGYARISRVTQSIQRQIDNINKDFKVDKIYQEAITGTTQDRKEWNKLKKLVKVGDTIIFDSVSRLSRNAEAGVEDYIELFERGVNLIFIKERYIDTTVYSEQMKANDLIQVVDDDINSTVMEGIRKYLKRIARKQIIIAFEQAEKEVLDLQQRTKEGLKVAKENGTVLGRKEGVKVETKKSLEMKKEIKKYSKEFNGSLKDIDVMKILKVSRNTYYKYKKEMLVKHY